MSVGRAPSRRTHRLQHRPLRSTDGKQAGRQAGCSRCCCYCWSLLPAAHTPLRPPEDLQTPLWTSSDRGSRSGAPWRSAAGTAASLFGCDILPSPATRRHGAAGGRPPLGGRGGRVRGGGGGPPDPGGLLGDAANWANGASWASWVAAALRASCCCHCFLPEGRCVSAEDGEAESASVPFYWFTHACWSLSERFEQRKQHQSSSLASERMESPSFLLFYI